ncbi:hypothetical protein [Neisseria sicca]|jgi:hypothetical protein|uniref:hypothetical protein n=1 Tax=Neisseria sicca TaxID=490 RepID=UPI000D2F7CD3|nr:hypothetical protein [Neisseria sicca]MBF1286313.1 hypothetical protein [Neisseria sp.]
MIKIVGIKNLIDSKESLLDYGFLYTLKDDDVETQEGLLKCTFLLPETESDELFIENNKDYQNWLEAPMFIDIIDIYTENHSDATTCSLINAVLHYWNHDDFLD